MFLDLASTIVGGILVLIGEAVVTGLLIVWAITPKKKTNKMKCPFIFDGTCDPKCEGFKICETERKMHFEQFV